MPDMALATSPAGSLTAACTSETEPMMSDTGLFFFRSSIALRSSSSSAWRAISSKLLRNSPAMARALPAHLPAMCIRRGKSFGPTMISAAASRMTMWLQLNRSNIARFSDRGLVLVADLGVDHLGVFLVVLRQALLEAVDALAEVAHKVRDLAPAAEQDQ